MIKVFLLLSAMLLGSCSLPGIGYRYADWLIKKRILKVIKLYGPEQRKLELILDEYMLWHQKEMLDLYEKELLLIKSDFNKKDEVSSETIDKHLELMRDLYFKTILPLSDRVSPLLVGLNEDQIERSKTLLNRKVEERKEDLSLDAEELKEKKKKQWLDNLENFLGSVSDEQKELLNQEIKGLIYSPKARYAHSVLRVKTFIDILEDHKEPKVRALKLKEYFQNWKENDPYEKWRDKLVLFLDKLQKTLSKEQRDHLNKKIDYWIGVLRELKSI